MTKNRNLLIAKIKPYLGYIIFISLFLFVYFPHFILFKQPLIGRPDSHLYLMTAFDIYELKIPLKNYENEYPIGLSIFIALNYLLSGNLFTVIIFQTLIQFSLVLWLIKLIHKFHGLKTGIITSIVLSLFFTLSDMVLWNTLIYTESLFISAIILTAGNVYAFLQKGRKSHLIYAVLGIFMAMLIRSNAIFLLFIPVLLFLLKKDIRTYITLLFFGLILSLSLTNSIFHNSFSPIETSRYSIILSQLYKFYFKGVIPKEKSPNVERTLTSQTLKLLTNLGNGRMGNHYYYRVPNHLIEDNLYNFKLGYNRNQISNTNMMYKKDSSLFDDQEYFKFVKRDLELENNLKQLSNIDKYPRHPWLLVINYYHYLKFLVRNHFITGLFFFSFIYSLIKYFKNKSNPLFESILFFGLIHFASICLLAITIPRDTSLSRYSIVTELFCYISILLTFSSIITKRKITYEQEYISS